MKILVPLKRVLDYNVRVRIRQDQSGVDLDGAKMSMNPFDEIAVEQAVQMKEAGLATEVVALSIGDEKAPDTLRAALAMGADRAIHVRVDGLYEFALDSLAIAKALAKLVQEETPDLVIMGKQSIDSDSGQTGAMLAALLDWPMAALAAEIKCVDNQLEVICETDQGTQTLALPLPAIITTDLRLNTPRYASLPNIMKARSKPIQVKQWADLGIVCDVMQEVVNVQPPSPRQAGHMVESCEELVSVLQQKGVLS